MHKIQFILIAVLFAVVQCQYTPGIGQPQEGYMGPQRVFPQQPPSSAQQGRTPLQEQGTPQGPIPRYPGQSQIPVSQLQSYAVPPSRGSVPQSQGYAAPQGSVSNPQIYPAQSQIQRSRSLGYPEPIPQGPVAQSQGYQGPTQQGSGAQPQGYSPRQGQISSTPQQQQQGQSPAINFANLFKQYFNIFTGSPPASMIPGADQSRLPILPSFEHFFKAHSKNLTEISKKCPPQSMFASFNPSHRMAVEDLVALYDDKQDDDTFLEFSQFTKSRPEIHPHVWYGAFIKAQAKGRPSFLSLHRPSAIALFPSEFFPDIVLQTASQSQSQPEQAALQGIPQSQPQQVDSPTPTNEVVDVDAPSRSKRQSGWPQPWSPGSGPVLQPQPQTPIQPPIQPQPQPQASPPVQGQCVQLDERVGQDNGPENALWYFREHIQLNSHHFLWHLMFPGVSRTPLPRRGELFYFFHHDLLARYWAERMANGLQPIDPLPLFIDVNTVIDEGYNAHLTDGVSTDTWNPRASRTPLNTNTLSNDMMTTLRNHVSYQQRFIDILTSGNVNANGRSVPLTSADNTNMLGETLEASSFSVNPNYYGMPGPHNDVHWILANLRGATPGALGVLGHSATAMRDIIFYRIHKGVDNLLHSYKTNFLTPYALSTGENQLIFPGIRVNSFAAQSVSSGAAVNSLGTFWNTRNFNLQGGLDFNTNSRTRAPNVNVCVKHLDHDEFAYTIQVDNSRGRVANAFVRIYMAPRFRALNSQERYSFEEQRRMFFVVDSFVQSLQPGSNTIRRQSMDSTLTAPWPRSVEQLRQDVANGVRTNVNCECGFPHSLLLPKGTEQGMAFDLFVMLTDASVDYIPGNNQNQQNQCTPSHVHCGILGQPYPDAKPMGYPFDRRGYTVPVQTQDPRGNPVVQNIPVANLEAYVSNVPNMATVPITITHRNVQVRL